MAKNAKRKQAKEQRRKKRTDKKQQRTVVGTGQVSAGSRQQAQIRRWQPAPWDVECLEDVAVTCPSEAKGLSEEQTLQASAVIAAFQHLESGSWDDALDSVAQIPRTSIFSDWRLFIRGYVAWCDNDRELADKAWDRLDAERRPARMAAALKAAHRSDLETAADEKLDATLLKAAKLVRRIRIDRPSLRIAAAGLKKKEEDEDESEDFVIGPDKIKWLRDFCKDYRGTEPELVSALEQAALKRVFQQPYVDVFSDGAKTFAGPPHDPKNNLLRFFYHNTSREVDQRANLAINSYLMTDLPLGKRLPPALRDALISMVHVRQAGAKQELLSRQFDSTMARQQLRQEIEDHHRNAIRVYPENSDAHEQSVEWLEQRLKEENLTDAKEQEIHATQLTAYTAWQQSRPDDAKPHQWLMEHFLDSGDLEQAKVHADWLTKCRHEDPLIRVSAWKWQLLEVMQLCRRKSNVKLIPERIKVVGEAWPSWLSRDWLGYLIAASLARFDASEDSQEILKQRESLSGPVTHAVMQLAAAQRMNLPATALKPLRVPIAEAIKVVNLKKIDFQDLVSLGSFYWDLKRTRLSYPAYRSHGTKFSREFAKRLAKQPSLISKHIQDPDFRAALYWISEDEFRATPHQQDVPGFITQFARQNPYVLAALVNGRLNSRCAWKVSDVIDEIHLLREIAGDQADTFYRYWLNQLADNAEDKAKDGFRGLEGFGGLGGPNGPSFGDFRQMFSSMMGAFGDISNSDFSDDDDECMREACQARRALEGYSMFEPEDVRPTNTLF